ncbi:hypothetical protein V8C42DRAFT_332715 [Trichoderma barbatum]
MASTIANTHPFYRLFFQKLDPIIMVWSAYLNLRKGSFTSRLVFHHYEDPYTNPAFRDDFVFEQTLGLMAAVAALAALLQHYSDDLNVWRIIQGVLLIWNFACLNGASFALRLGGLFEPVSKGVECVYCIEVCTVLIIIRILFLVGYGGRGSQRIIKNGVIYRT